MIFFFSPLGLLKKVRLNSFWLDPSELLVLRKPINPSSAEAELPLAGHVWPWDSKTCVSQVTAHTSLRNPKAQSHCTPRSAAVSSGFFSRRRDERGSEGRGEIMTQICSCKPAINSPHSPLREGKRNSGIQVSHSLTRSSRAF